MDTPLYQSSKLACQAAARALDAYIKRPEPDRNQIESLMKTFLRTCQQYCQAGGTIGYWMVDISRPLAVGVAFPSVPDGVSSILGIVLFPKESPIPHAGAWAFLQQKWWTPPDLPRLHHSPASFMGIHEELTPNQHSRYLEFRIMDEADKDINDCQAFFDRYLDPATAAVNQVLMGYPGICIYHKFEPVQLPSSGLPGFQLSYIENPETTLFFGI